MKKTFAHILKFLLLSLFSIISIILLITTFFSDEIEKSVINIIDKNLESPLVLDNVELTLFENFPSTSVKITNLLICESKEFNNDTLLFSKKSYIDISLLNIINKNYTIENILIENAKINIKYNHSNIPNFLIFKNNKNKTDLSIKNIVLTNTKLKINNHVTKLNLSWKLNRSLISINNQKFKFKHDGVSNKLIVDNVDFLKNKKINFTAETKITKDTIKILESNLDVENVFLNIAGTILTTNNLNLEITGESQEIHSIITNLPKNLKHIFSPIITNGEVTFYSSIKGLINNKNNPSFLMNYKITNGLFELKSMPFKLYNVEMNGEVSNGENKNFNSTEIKANLFKAQTKNGYIDGEFILKNLNNYFLSSKFESSWDLNIVNQYFEDSPFIGMSGELTSKTNYEGNIAFDNRFKRMFLNAKHKSDVTIKNMIFKYQILPLDFSIKNAKLYIEKHKIIVNYLQSTISETDVDFKGEIQNFIPYLLQDAPKIYINGDINSTYTNFSELITSTSRANVKDQNILPNWINANTNININNFSYKNFMGSSLNGLISYENSEINTDNLNAKLLNGEINTEFNLSELANNQLKLVTNMIVKKINIRNSFDAFNNYNQTFIKKEHLKGVGNAKLYIESYWDHGFVLDKEKLKVNSHLIIEKGELINFKPLEKLSSYISLEELKNVKFSTLENTINISNKVITIPTMEIKSSALSVLLSGTHTFSKKINYEITLLLSEILSKSFRKKNTSITEFGEEEKDGKIFNTIYLKMEGDTENSKVSLNKIRFMEDLSNSVKKEKNLINDILKEDILKDKKPQKKEEGQEIEIEWDPKIY